jgi:hypothetical protein
LIIVALADIHGHIERLADMADALSGADAVLLTGDLTHFGRRRDAERVLEAVRKHNPRVLAGGVAFLGLGGSLPCPGRTPSEYSDAQLKAFLEEAAMGLEPGLPLVLASHQPPVDTLVDRVHSGLHVGSESVRRFIEDRQPLVCFTGHIHEGRGVDRLGRTMVVNPGPAGQGWYAFAEVDGGLKALEIRQCSHPQQARGAGAGHGAL